MTTTVEIPDEVMDRVMRAVQAHSPQEAVVKAMEECASRHDQRRLIPLLGTSDGFMTPEELDAMREMD
jgi:Arc/MetJ family transcription regulator